MNPPKTVVLGLTGSIGMGKSATAAMFAKRGVPVHDSDAAVHALYRAGGRAGPAIAEIVPDAVLPDGSVDRSILRQAVIDRPDRLAALEQAVHPLVQAESRAFVIRHSDQPIVVLDIPLLYETGAEARCDAVLVVTAAPEVQRARVLARPGMDTASFAAILAKQLPDREKRSRADFVIDTGLGFEHAEREVDAILNRLRR
ncbi:MAG: dephospho-CoA kinase [Methylobacterium sp.]|uniref:dephospho-CoA kinase n=1 Tax=Methylobacterium sp. TaxID=409 RepID=UPI0025D8E481|nr:dephospho-CoA kinase [Methylobacterium sp.]MBX9933851.1 dephospho-CoA kinase [Methylobacterium sp.]